MFISTFLFSCKNEIKDGEYVAFFGGEVINPLTKYVLFCKGDEVLDTLKLDQKNKFFIKFDSLSPGLYNFKHDAEYQNVYFDKNDSIMVRINSKDFDESIFFCGRGDEKNNFLMEIYLQNEKMKNEIYPIFDYDITNFNKSIESFHKKNNQFYQKRKEEINWNEEFDLFAKASINFPYYSKKELYPIVHKLRTGNDIFDNLPDNYYGYRKNIDCNNSKLSFYPPFILYISHMLNNMGTINYHNHFSEVDIALKSNIKKMNIADTLIKNKKIKNIVLNNIAFTYLLEDQNLVNTKSFLSSFKKISTDNSAKNEIIKIGQAIQMLTSGNELPEVILIDRKGDSISSKTISKKNTIIFFWTRKASSHFIAAHKKILDLKSRHPEYNFIAINLNDNFEDWNKTLDLYKIDGISEYKCANFEDLKQKWAITKIHRSIVLNKNGFIKNAFTDIFNQNFETNLY